MIRCRNCGASIPVQVGRGRQRIYCSRPCKDAKTNRCKVQRCPRYANAPDGFCSTHYRRELKSQRQWTARDAILDWLELDGGWLTVEGLATDLGRNVQAVERVLRALESEGKVERRVVELTSFPIHGRTRTEWHLAALERVS